MSKAATAAIIAGFFTVFIHFSVRYGYGMLLPEMLPALDITKTEAGIVVTLFFIIYTLIAPITGILSDHLSFKIILPFFVFVLGLGAFLLSTASNMFQISIFYSIAAVGGAGCWAPVMVFIQRTVPEKQKGFAVSLVGTGTCAGIFLTGIMLPILVSNFDWRAGWFVLGLTGLSVSVINVFMIRNPQTSADIKKIVGIGPRSFLNRYQPIFEQPNFWKIAIAYLLVGFNLITVFSFLPLYLSEGLHVQYFISTRAIAVIAATGIVGQLFLGYLSDIFGRKAIMVVCGIFLGVPCLGFVLFPTIWLLYIMAGFWGFGYGAVCALYSASASDFFPKQYTGGIVGIWTSFLGLGSIIAPIISGRIIDVTHDYSGVFLTAMLVALLSASIIAMTRKPLSATHG